MGKYNILKHNIHQIGEQIKTLEDTEWPAHLKPEKQEELDRLIKRLKTYVFDLQHYGKGLLIRADIFNVGKIYFVDADEQDVRDCLADAGRQDGYLLTTIVTGKIIKL